MNNHDHQPECDHEPILTKKSLDQMGKTLGYNAEHSICQHDKDYCAVNTNPKQP